ncbi:MAG TPA: hypothetical protein VIF02_14260 [Methylocella sp.]|jgi:hypothetical protein
MKRAVLIVCAIALNVITLYPFEARAQVALLLRPIGVVVAEVVEKPVMSMLALAWAMFTPKPMIAEPPVIAEPRVVIADKSMGRSVSVNHKTGGSRKKPAKRRDADEFKG